MLLERRPDERVLLASCSLLTPSPLERFSSSSLLFLSPFDSTPKKAGDLSGALQLVPYTTSDKFNPSHFSRLFVHLSQLCKAHTSPLSGLEFRGGGRAPWLRFSLSSLGSPHLPARRHSPLAFSLDGKSDWAGGWS